MANRAAAPPPVHPGVRFNGPARCVVVVHRATVTLSGIQYSTAFTGSTAPRRNMPLRPGRSGGVARGARIQAKPFWMIGQNSATRLSAMMLETSGLDKKTPRSALRSEQRLAERLLGFIAEHDGEHHAAPADSRSSSDIADDAEHQHHHHVEGRVVHRVGADRADHQDDRRDDAERNAQDRGEQRHAWSAR